MSEAEFARFADALRASLRRHCPRHEIDLANGLWRPKGAETGVEYGLQNVAQIFHGGGGAESVDHFIANTLTIQARATEATSLSWEEIQPRLRVRLFPVDYPHVPLVTAPLCDSFITTLVADFPEHVQTVVADDAKEWPVDKAGLFDIALENLWRHEPIVFQEIQDPSGAVVQFGMAEHFYAASHALLLDRYLEDRSPVGAIVAIPNRHVLIVHPIESRSALGLLAALPIGVRGLYEQGPGSITPDILWWRAGQFRTVEYNVSGDVVGPEEMLDVLDGLR